MNEPSRERILRAVQSTTNGRPGQADGVVFDLALPHPPLDKIAFRRIDRGLMDNRIHQTNKSYRPRANVRRLDCHVALQRSLDGWTQGVAVVNSGTGSGVVTAAS